MKIQRARFLLFFSIGMALLILSACTPAPYNYIVVEKVGVSDDIFYVRASKHCTYCEDVGGYAYYASKDHGRTWEEIASPADVVLQLLTPESNKESSVCISANGKICYRIVNQEQVEISTDRGATWQIDWQLPSGRKLFMQRLARGYLDTIPFDIQKIESSGKYFVVVAMGNQGVLVKSSDGDWSRYSVGNAVPTPYQAASLSETIEVLDSELVSIIAIAFGGFLFLSFCVWGTVYFNSDGTPRKKAKKSFLLFFLSLVLLFGFSLLSSSPQTMDKLFGNYRGFHYILILIFALGFRLVYILPLISYLIAWIVVISISINKTFGWLSLLFGVVFLVIFFFCVLFPFQLWVLGTILVYETARLYAWIAGTVTLLIACFIEFRIALLSVKQVNK